MFVFQLDNKMKIITKLDGVILILTLYLYDIPRNIS